MPLTRRIFLRSSSHALLGTLVYASGPVALLAPSRSWSMPLDNLNTHQGQVLLQVTRHIFPHPGLEDVVYAFVVRDLDKGAAKESARQLLSKGIADLDESAGGNWLALSEQQQFEHVQTIADIKFFEIIRSTAVVSLYNNPLAFAHFGYQGEDGDGGYLHKGFNDLAWLPDPPQPQGGYLPSENI